MDIVDAQVHIGCGMIDSTLEAMDALGINSVVLDEFWGTVHGAHPAHAHPGYLVGNGGWRAASPTAEAASILHPQRFAYLVRIDRLDPQLESLMRVIASSPHARALRLLTVASLAETQAFRDGAYDELCDIAQDIGLPVFVFIPGFVELLPRYLKKYPRLTFIVDHCGMGFPGMPADRPEDAARRTLQAGYFDAVLELAQFPNVALKWSHAQARFNVTRFPYAALRPLLRRAIQAFGASRIMWASDKSVVTTYSWSDLLHYLRDDPELSGEEKAWILGRSVRQILNWPPASNAT